MIKIFKRVLWNTLNLFRLSGIIQINSKNSYLRTNGWYKSHYSKESIDNLGNPIPWCTYPFIKFIEDRLKKNMDIFEYGCGNSTIWFALKVNSVTSIDHDENWIVRVRPKLPKNAQVIYRKLEYGGEYCQEIHVSKKQYHVVIIDGRDRINCAKQSVRALTNDGIIIFDNSQRNEYREAMEYLGGVGFRRLDFHGLPPIAHFENCTTIFYKSENCLGL